MGLDLLTHAELKDAQADLSVARVRQAEAQRRFLFAPHGQRTTRLTALQEAVQTTLKAELRVARLQVGEA